MTFIATIEELLYMQLGLLDFFSAVFFFIVPIALTVWIVQRYKTLRFPLLVITLILNTLLVIAFITWILIMCTLPPVVDSFLLFLMIMVPPLLLLVTLVALTILVALRRSPFRAMLIKTLALTVLLVAMFIVCTQHSTFASKSFHWNLCYFSLLFYVPAILISASMALAFVAFFIFEKNRRVKHRITNLPLIIFATLVLIFYGWQLLG